ncbi:28S ribosomal S34 protein [Hirschfeldia incana]|nr:28S ribosomal S34 protein [Hirschfeldia incana]KAJ0261432.1 28S ribosomal S34 protein [Hirschfeldia incana]
MAASLMNRTVSRTETLGAFRLSLNLLRNFSSPAATESPSSDPIKAKRRKNKNKNLIEVAQFLPNWGIGYHMAKAHWSGVSYEITKINLYKDGRHGKAWGIVHKDGLRAGEASKKISGVHKRCWKYIPNLSKTTPAVTAAQVQAS